MSELTFTPFGAIDPAQVQQSIDYTLSQIAGTKRDIANCTEALTNIDALLVNKTFDVTPALALLPPPLQELVSRSIKSYFADHDYRRTAYQRNIRDYEQTYDRFTNALTKNRQALAIAATAAITVTRAEVCELLANLPNVVRSSIRVGLMGRGNNKKGAIRWRFSGIKMRPDVNPYANINYGQQDVAITLPDCVVTVWPSEGKVKIQPVDGSDTGVSTTYNNNAAHPHMMRDHFPCLGGFQHNFIEGCQNGDIQTIAYTLHAFLAQANNDDGAGSHWPRWIVRDRASTNRFEWRVDNRNNSMNPSHIVVRVGMNYQVEANGAIAVSPLAFVRAKFGESFVTINKEAALQYLTAEQMGELPTNFHADETVFYTDDAPVNWY